MEPSPATTLGLQGRSWDCVISQRLTHIVLGLAVLIFFSYAPLAQAKTLEQYVLKAHHHCKAQYVKKVERVKVKKHGHTRVVSEAFCVRLASKTVLPKVVAPITPPGPVVTPPASFVPQAPGHVETVLHAHIDPSFVQSPTDPYKVTYQYSASATEGSSGTSVASLPEGVLNLFSDGLLACSINVGGQVMGGECTVIYAKLGEHGVIVTYTSGTSNGTETYVEHIEPFPTVIVNKPTTTKANVTVSEVRESQVVFNSLKTSDVYENASAIRVSRPDQPNGGSQEAINYLQEDMSVTLTSTSESGVIVGIHPIGMSGPGEEEEELQVEPKIGIREPTSYKLSLPNVWHEHVSIVPETTGPVVKPTLSLRLVKYRAFERARKGEELLDGYSAFYEPKEGFEAIATVSYPETIVEGPTEGFHLTSEHWLPSIGETVINSQETTSVPIE